MQPKTQKIKQAYNKHKQNSSHLLHVEKIQQTLDELSLKLPYDNEYTIKKKYFQRTNDQGQPIIYINQKEFIEIVLILTNKIESFLADFQIECRDTLKHFKEYMEERQFVVMDRGADTKIILRIGEEQQYQNYLKVEVQKINSETVQRQNIPHIRIEFQTNSEEDKVHLLKIFENILQKVDEILKTIMMDDSQQETEVHYTSLMKFLQKSTKITQNGVQILIELISEHINQTIQTLASCLDKAFNSQGNSVQAKFKTSFQFNQNLKYLLDTSQPYNIFDVLSKNWELSVCLTVGQLMSAIKQIFIKSQQFSELKYEKFHLPGLLAIALSNTQQLQTIIELNNIEFNEQERALVESFTIALNRYIQQSKKSEEFQQIYQLLEQEFKIQEIISKLGKKINIYVDLIYFKGSIQLCIDGLGSLLKKFMHFAKVQPQAESQ